MKINFDIAQMRSDVERRYNIPLARKIGFQASGLLSELLALEDHYILNETILDNNWFKATPTFIVKRIGMTEKEQKKAVEVLLKNGFIECNNIGNPSARHFRMNHEKIIDFMVKLYEEEENTQGE